MRETANRIVRVGSGLGEPPAAEVGRVTAAVARDDASPECWVMILLAARVALHRIADCFDRDFLAF